MVGTVCFINRLNILTTVRFPLCNREYDAMSFLLLALCWYCHFFTCKCLNLFVKSLHAADFLWKTNKIIKDFDLIDWLIEWSAVDSRNPPSYHSGCRKDNEAGGFRYIVGKVHPGFVQQHIWWGGSLWCCQLVAAHVCANRLSCLCMFTHILSLLSGLNGIKGRWIWTVHFFAMVLLFCVIINRQTFPAVSAKAKTQKCHKNQT